MENIESIKGILNALSGSEDFFNEYQEDTKKQLSKWMNGQTQKELQNLQLVFDYYQLKLYSADNVLPIR